MIEHQPAIVISEASTEVGDELESKLLTTLRDTLPQSANASFVLSANLRDASHEEKPNRLEPTIGGLTASTSYGWLLIKILWVDATYRRKGVGCMLLEQAERRALEFGCHSVWLDTSSPQAKTFYAAQGFTVFGLLSNSPTMFPAGHQRWFMQKSLGTEL